MTQHARFVLLAVAALAQMTIHTNARAEGDKVSQSQCQEALVAITRLHPKELRINELRCESLGMEGKFLVFAVRSSNPAPKNADPGWVGSNLVGWYARRSTDGVIFEWNVGQLQPGEPVKSCKGRRPQLGAGSAA